MKNQTSKTIRSFQTSVNAIINRIAFASFITLFLLNGLVSAQSAQVVPSLSLVDQTNSASASGEVRREGVSTRPTLSLSIIAARPSAMGTGQITEPRAITGRVMR